jgi:hypothetical protein
MNLSDFLLETRKTSTVKDWCERKDLPYGSVMLVAGGHRKAGPKLAQRISKASGGLVPLAALRADLWG